LVNAESLFALCHLGASGRRIERGRWNAGAVRAWKVGALEGFDNLLFILLAAFWFLFTAWMIIGVRAGEAWRRQQ
jgi:hypothetical protein